MRQVGQCEIRDYDQEFRIIAYALYPTGRYVMAVEYMREGRVLSSTVIDIGDAMTKAVNKPEFCTSPPDDRKVEPKQADSAIGVFLPGVTSDDTVVVDMPDGRFRLYDDKTKSFMTLNKKIQANGNTCQCNIANLAANGCGCGGVRYSNVGMAVSTPDETETVPANVREQIEAALRGPIYGSAGAAIGTAIGAAVPPRRRGGNILRSQNEYTETGNPPASELPF